MAIVINGSGTVTGVTNVGSAAANTAVVLQDSGSNTNTCRAWVNFNGTGTVAIRASFNVSSITDNGTGDYTVNFTTALVDANYSVVSTSISYNSNGGGGEASMAVRNTTTTDWAGPPDMNTTNVRLLSSTTLGTFYDRGYVGVAIFR